MKVYLLQFAKILALIVLPFILLIRGSVFFHASYQFSPWMALLMGVLLSSSIVFLYLLYIRERITDQEIKVTTIKRTYAIAFVLLFVYCLPALFYLSATNAKHQSVQKEFTSLHPILRLGISTLLILDRDVILTDAQRVPEDYKKMGLPTKKASLHYRQSDGYAHAVDIRTRGHSEVRNFLIKTYFQAMGFRTLRHIGTADHLHISIMSHDRPGAI